MKRATLLNLLFLATIGMSCDGILRLLPGAAGGDTTILTLGTPAVKPLPVVWREEYNAGNVKPGDHTQHMLDLTYCESDPDRIYMGQDVSSVWVSRDNGLNWYTLRNEGLNSQFIISVEVDPLDKNRVLAAAQCRFYVGVNQDYQGIYLSLDGGITWQRKIARTDLGEVRSITKLITYAPTSKDREKGFAKRWYAAFGEYKKTEKGSHLNADDGLLYSDDGGENWTEIRKLPAAGFGDRIRGIKVHATTQDKVFLYGNEGLFRFENVTDPNGTVTKLSGRNGLPEGDIWGRLFQTRDGNTLIVAVAGKGIYKSVNGGDSWSLLYDWADVNYCYVNENFPHKIFAVPNEKSKKQLRISNDGGQTWFEPTDNNVNYRPGYAGNPWVKKLSGQFTYILPDPRNADHVFIHTKSKNFRSVDGGVTWNVSDNGFNGASYTGSEQMFDPVNPDRFCYFMTDRGVTFTNTRGRWFYQNKMNIHQLGLPGLTSRAGALHPDQPVILASVGKSPNGKLLRSGDDGLTWNVVSEGIEARWVIGFDLQNPDYCYQAGERSSDAGLTWTSIPDMPDSAIICGISRSDGKVIYAMNINGSRKKVWRSIDRGDTWQWVIDSPWDLTFPGPNNMFIFQIDPQNPDIVYTSHSNGHLSKWDISDYPNVQRTDISVGGVAEDNFFINLFAVDARYPGIMYAINQRANTGNKFFRTIDGGVTWQNISDYIPQGSVTGLAVSPVTGEVYISSQSGSLVMLPPYQTSNTAFEAVPYTNNHLTEPYR